MMSEAQQIVPPRRNGKLSLNLGSPEQAKERVEQIQQSRLDVIEAKRVRDVKAEAAFRQCRRRFGRVFNPSDPKPLAIGIDKKIRKALGVSHSVMSQVLRKWVKRREYHEALAKTGSQRYDLKGSPVGPVSAEDRRRARRALQRRAKR